MFLCCRLGKIWRPGEHGTVKRQKVSWRKRCEGICLWVLDYVEKQTERKEKIGATTHHAPHQSGLSVVNICGPSAPPVIKEGEAHSFGKKIPKRGQISSSLFSFMSTSSLYTTKVKGKREVTTGHFLPTSRTKCRFWYSGGLLLQTSAFYSHNSTRGKRMQSE